MRKAAPLAFALGVSLSSYPGEAHPSPERDEAPRAEQDRREWGILPAIGYNPDTGLDMGVFTHVARHDPEVRPYRWRVRAQLQTSLLLEDGLEFPKFEHYLRLDLPRLPDAPSRLRLDATWKRQLNAGYFGVGNASRVGRVADEGSEFHEYRIEMLRAKAVLERRLAGHQWRGLGGVELARLAVDRYADSLLERDLENARARGQTLFGADDYTALVVQGGLVLDSRDHETFPTRGLFHDLVLRAAPSLGEAPAWGGLTYTTRFYLPLQGRSAVLATRLLADVLLGEPPLSELGRYGGLLPGEAFGGADGVRGITGGRYVGKTKVLGNAELRAQLLPFRALGESMNLGAAAFLDVGRVFAKTLAPEPRRDGDGLGLHWGAGAGPRLRWGDALLVRLDVAHSPHTSELDGGELAVYLTADSAF